MSDRIADAKLKLSTLLAKVPQGRARGAGNDPVRAARSDAESAFFHAEQVDQSTMTPEEKERMRAIHAGKAEEAIERLEKVVSP